MSTGNLSESSTSITKSIDNVKRIIVFFLIFVSIAAVLIFTPMNDVISQTSPIISSQAQDTHVFNHSDSLVIVSCVGDSITKGSGSSKSLISYPSLLQKRLGKKFHVANYGVGGASASRISDIPYWNTEPYKASLRSKPHIVILQLGTNDAKNTTW
eukprot:CAMPEP_0119039156 /NCGR_PEP_ID=MMETSP1177-20130426/8504_1 /TAXON_ID=2985 /ORGANISM="Ochromonas sp, Strain CCMP1899" /LENGTH=155 /DNA_ID=CAMNT_0007002687 /DNA_START=43 /DNA_END=507 /DNA_ORIENTATION=-